MLGIAANVVGLGNCVDGVFRDGDVRRAER
jgi:hypothetical protein